MAEPQLSKQRQFERRQLITIFAGLEPGAEIAFEEIKAMTGLDHALDRSLIYGVREHCREVLGIVVDIKGSLYRRLTDEELAGQATDRRRQRIYKQAVRGAGEAAAVVDFASLGREVQHGLLAKQAIFGAVTMMSHRGNVERLAERIQSRSLSHAEPEDVIAAARDVK